MVPAAANFRDKMLGEPCGGAPSPGSAGSDAPHCVLLPCAFSCTAMIATSRDPTNSYGFWNFAGNMAWICLLMVLTTSYAIVRNRAYNTFRVAHWMFWPVSGAVPSDWHQVRANP